MTTAVPGGRIYSALPCGRPPPPTPAGAPLVCAPVRATPSVPRTRGTIHPPYARHHPSPAGAPLVGALVRATQSVPRRRTPCVCPRTRDTFRPPQAHPLRVPSYARHLPSPAGAPLVGALVRATQSVPRRGAPCACPPPHAPVGAPLVGALVRATQSVPRRGAPCGCPRTRDTIRPPQTHPLWVPWPFRFAPNAHM